MTTMPETRIALGIGPDGRPVPLRLTDTGALNVSGGAGFGPGASALNGVLIMGLTPTGQFVPLAVDASGNLITGVITAHSGLTGLSANDHPQYVLTTLANFPATATDYGNYPIQVARVPFDPSADATLRTQGDHTISQIVLPTNTVIVGSWYDTVTAFHSANETARLAVKIQSAGDITNGPLVSAIPWTAQRNNGSPSFGFGNSIKLTAPRSPVFTVTIQDLTAGRTMLNLLFIPGTT